MNLVQKAALKARLEAQFLLRERLNLFSPMPGSIWKSCVGPYLNGPAHMIDAGAHIGADSIEFARLFPNLTVHAFEPIPDIYAHLARNTRRYDRIHCYPLALSGRSGKQEMHVSSGASDASSSLLAPKSHAVDHPDVHFDGECTVECMTLDGWAQANGVSDIAFLWLDLQGCELDVLRSGIGVLQNVRAIHTEVSTRETYTGAVLYPELKAWLSEQGFAARIEAIPDGNDMGNVLFVRER